MFLPTTQAEVKALNWSQLDVILVSGDSYIDSPFIGVAVIGRVLADAGYKVGIIAQPDVITDKDIIRLGEPRLFWGITGGSVDSMVANYTATGRKRRRDDFTPGGVNNRRPDRAVIVYSNLIRRHFKDTRPIVLGGVEASLRRVAHYDFHVDKIRRSILFDAKADYLLYGMAELTVVQLAERIDKDKSVVDLKGLCYVANEVPAAAVKLPSFETVSADKLQFTEMFHTFYSNNDHLTGHALAQKQDTRYLIQNPPAPPLDQTQLDRVHELEFQLDQHPHYQKLGSVKALETIRFSLLSHRGCYGECSFCGITVHQGWTVTWRSPDSLVREARRLVKRPDFKGTISDVGGPTANMYGFECKKKLSKGMCLDKRCVYPDVCRSMPVNHGPQIELLQRLRQIKGVQRVIVASGIRHDIVLADKQTGRRYLHEVVKHHVSGQMKLAPEHSEDKVLNLMGKPNRQSLVEFRKMFFEATQQAGKNQFLTYYLIAAHPGCSDADMLKLKSFVGKVLKLNPEQVQVFTPLPSTYSALMYHTGKDPFTGQSLHVVKDITGKLRQKKVLEKTRR
jgi:uncharacterized radical SAM protein YgiQ